MEYIISQGSARHYASKSWTWGRKHAYIDLNVCLFNQLKRWKLPVNRRQARADVRRRDVALCSQRNRQVYQRT